jgi:ABC-type nitrate/sulfonate/bicarbonate transport system ATPase subunit
MAYIEFNNTSISFGAYSIFENLSFDIQKGEIVTLFGPSGCGKSSLMKSLLDIVPVSQGEILINGDSANSYSNIMGYVPQDNQLLPWMSVEANIELWRTESKNNNPNATLDILEVIGLNKHKKKLPKELSGGMKRRTALARALVTSTEILCLDEVLVSIERGMRRELMLKMREYIKKNNITTLLISHDYEEAIFMSDKIYVLSPSPTVILKSIEIEAEDRTIDYFNTNAFENNAKKLVS